MSAFYLVWREDGSAPTRKHTSPSEARQEACRLARKHPGSRFYVLRCVAEAMAETPPVQWTEHAGNCSYTVAAQEDVT